MNHFRLASLALCLGAILFPSDARAEDVAEPGASIAALARASEGQKFGRGECWDFAAALLDRTNSDWERPRQFLHPKCGFPGIGQVQFKPVM